ncbi:MAG: hypothetical protein L6R35_005655 [Caloplaca aegaea]|nr:MAG: hypothetical protein L6R35_005655 [Caloplaca aegaea]
MEPCEKYKNFAESQNSETMNNALTKRFFYLPYGEHELLYSLSDPTTHEDKIREEERLKEKNLSGRGSNAMKKRGYYQPTYKEAVKEAGLEGKKTGFKEEETVWDRFFRGENPFDKRSYNLPETEELGRKLSRRGIDAIRKRYYSWGADTAVEMESWQEKMRDALVSDPAAFGMDESQVEGFRKFKEISDSQKKGSERKLSRRGIDAIRKRGYFVGDWEASKEELRDLMLSHPEAFGMDKSQVEGLRKNKEKSEAKKEESERKLSERGSNAIRKRLFYWRSTYEKARDKVLSHPEAFDIDESDLEILRVSKDINAQWKILEKEGKKEKGKDYGATIFGDGDSSAV